MESFNRPETSAKIPNLRKRKFEDFESKRIEFKPRKIVRVIHEAPPRDVQAPSPLNAPLIVIAPRPEFEAPFIKIENVESDTEISQSESGTNDDGIKIELDGETDQSDTSVNILCRIKNTLRQIAGTHYFDLL